MDTLQTMRIFVRVAHRAGFAAAARDLRMSAAAVTKHVAALEARVGARLLDRTTRNVSLTEAGRVYLERCQECLQAFEDADASVSELTNEPRGVLRVTAPVDLQGDLAAVVGRFVGAHAGVRVDLRLSNRPVDLVEEGIDVAVRVAAALDGAFVARPLARVRMILVASPAYLRAHGHPRAPREVTRHAAIVFAEPRLRDEWTLARGARKVKVVLTPAITTNGGEAARRAALEGAGIFTGPSFVVHEDLRAGRVVRVLPEWELLPEARLWAMYPHRRFVATKVRAFVEALREAFGDGSRDPWWP